MTGRLLALAVVASAGLASLPASAPAQDATDPAGAATDGPGALSHFALARKDCVGTAQNTALEGLVHGRRRRAQRRLLPDQRQHQQRDAAVRRHRRQHVHRPADARHDLHGRGADERALTCRVTATAKSGRYRIVTDYLTDPDRPTVILRSRFQALRGRSGDYRLYVRFDPTSTATAAAAPATAAPDSGGTRSAGHTLLVGSDPVTATNAANRDYALPVHSRARRARPFREVSNGFAGAASDGLTQLDADAPADHDLQRRRARQPRSDRARRPRPRRRVHARARLRRQPGAARARPRARTLRRAAVRPLIETTRAAGTPTTRAPERSRGGRAASSARRWSELVDEYYLSANYVKAAEDKTFPGAVAAALASPWGQAVSAGDTDQHLLRLLPRGLRARPLRGLDGRLAEPATAHRARHDALPVRAPAARRTARCRATA